MKRATTAALYCNKGSGVEEIHKMTEIRPKEVREWLGMVLAQAAVMPVEASAVPRATEKGCTLQ